MTQPDKYVQQTDFSDTEKNGNNVNGTSLDNELASIGSSINHTIDNLGMIQRDDGQLKNGIVTKDKLDANLQGAIDNVEKIAIGIIPDATETIKGGVLIATDQDIIDGTNNNKVVTPKKLKEQKDSINNHFNGEVSRLDAVVTSNSNAIVTKQESNIIDLKANFPVTGNDSILYIDKSTNDIYCWSSTDSQYKKLTNHQSTIDRVYDNEQATTLLNTSVTELNQGIANNKSNIKVRKDTIAYVSATQISWSGKISNDNGTILESQTPLIADIALEHDGITARTPIVDKTYYMFVYVKDGVYKAVFDVDSTGATLPVNDAFQLIFPFKTDGTGLLEDGLAVRRGDAIEYILRPDPIIDKAWTPTTGIYTYNYPVSVPDNCIGNFNIIMGGDSTTTAALEAWMKINGKRVFKSLIQCQYPEYDSSTSAADIIDSSNVEVITYMSGTFNQSRYAQIETISYIYER